MLYLIATPIGNLSDFTFRAIAAIKECDYLLCEDTRHSGILLKHYDLQKPMRSYHKFNEFKKLNEIIEDLKIGKTIGLLSDAGTPGIADPGFQLIETCVKEGIQVIPIPGACAAIVALMGSGLCADQFQFVGFLPKKKSELTKLFQKILEYDGVTICYESPYRLKNSLSLLETLLPHRKIVIARELTKKFEEFIRGTPLSLKGKWDKKPPKGEIILLIDKCEE